MDYHQMEDLFIVLCFIAFGILYAFLMHTIYRFNKRIRIIDQAFKNNPDVIQAMIDLEEY